MKRNTLTAAVLAGMTGIAGMVSVSHAVNLNPDGLGQVLLYPYYTARGGNDTLISVVNTTTEAKAVKVRFIEALNSREVLDFNLYLSPFDVWTAAVTLEGDGGKMVTADTSCTVPYFVGNAADGVGEQEFLAFQYTAGNADGGPTGIERTASGYLEMLEMGSIPESSPFFAAIKHNNGVPGNCAALETAWASGGVWTVDPTLSPATGGLFGTGSILNVAEGTMFSYDATALDSFWGATQVQGLHTNPGDLFPNLASSSNRTSNTFDNGVVRQDTWGSSVEAVDATIMFDKLQNEYNVNPTVGTRSEWVVTFPTKAFHVDKATGSVGSGTDIPLAPFTTPWVASVGGQSCEAIDVGLWDREERTPAPGGLVVSPRPPGGPEFQLCREVNIVRFAPDTEAAAPYTEIFKEPARANDSLTFANFGLPSGFNNGWAEFDFGNVAGSAGERFATADSGAQYFGLPTIGFWAQRFTNGQLENVETSEQVLANYAGSYQHKGSRRFGQITAQ